MEKFFNRNVKDGCEFSVKLGSRFPDINDLRHFTSWRDGQLIQIRPLGYHTGKRIGYSIALIQFPNISYRRMNAPVDYNWSSWNRNFASFRKFTDAVDQNGKLPWDYKSTDRENGDFKSIRRRDYFFDFMELMLHGYLDTGQFESLYNFRERTGPIIIPEASFEHLLHHELGDHTRLSDYTDRLKASIASGEYDVGYELNYDDLSTFEADIAATMTGTLTAEHANEETSSDADFSGIDTDGYLLKITAASEAEHNGGAYGNGARISLGAYSEITVNDTNIGDIEFSSLAISCGGINTRGIYASNCGNILINRCLFAGDSSTNLCLKVYCSIDGMNANIRNNIVYGATNGDGININPKAWGSGGNHTIYNNTCCKNDNNIHQDNTGLGSSTLVTKNNLCQGSGSNDYLDDGGGFGTTSKNVSEDNTSPDASYQSKDLHTDTIFENYASNDYRFDPDGDTTNLAIVDDGDDLSGTFTDDIIGTTRSTWYIGAYEISGAGPGLSIPVAMHHYLRH